MVFPTTYAEWSVLFEKFGNGDDTVINEMENGQFLIDAGTAYRFCTIAEEAYKKRKQLWLNKFQRGASMENIKTDDDFAIILRNGRQTLIPLSKFTVLKGLKN
jgi:ureidoglycolate hydrolase